MKKVVITVGLFFALSFSVWAYSPDTVSVPVSDLLRLQDLLKSTLQQQENAMQESSELQKIIDSSEMELSGLRLNLTQLQQELMSLKIISEAQASEINRLLPLLAEQDRISQRQAELLSVTLVSNKRLKIALGVGIPVAAAVGAGIAWAVSK